ncbi:MAG TPA: hypothetical protein VF272_01975 [Candidatus Saccharimonadia bacterium]
MAVELVNKQYFDEKMLEQQAFMAKLFDVWMLEVAKKFASIEKRLDKLEQRLDGVEQRLDKVENQLSEIQLDLNEVRSRVFDTAQRQEWLALVRRVEVLEKALRK